MINAFVSLKQHLRQIALLSLFPLGAFGATVINETFSSSPATNFTVVSGGTWAVSGGRYVLSSPASGTILGNLSRHNTPVTGDYTLTTTVRITGTSALWNDAAIVFNYSDASNYYFVSLNEANDGLTNGLFRVQAGVQTELADFSALSVADTDYTLEISRSGALITVKRNGTVLGSASDSAVTGTYVGYGSKNDGAQFDNLLVTTPSDTTAPTAPGSLIGAAVSDSQINLSWTASTDDVGVASYQVYRDGTLHTTIATTTCSDTGLSAATSYTYKVKAADAAGNLSADSNSVTLSTLSSSGTPVEAASFGPNGTHWPSQLPTPFLYDSSVPNIVNVTCSWSAISTALAAITPAQAAAGVLIKIAPGALDGNGAGSGSTPVLQNLGSTTWTKRVTVAPRDGYGTVTIGISNNLGARIHNVHGVCFAGFIASSLRPTACVNSAIAWCKLTNWLGVSSSTNLASSGMELTEVVLPVMTVEDADSAQCATSTNGTISNFTFTGCYLAPTYRSSGSSHSDTLQFFGSAAYSAMVFKDCALFASSNCAIQTGDLNGLELHHCYIAAGAPALSRYPFPSGYTPPNTDDVTKTFNGGGGNFKAYDSIFIGQMPYTSSPWMVVSNTRVTQSVSLAAGGTGAWTVDSTLSSSVPDDYGVTLPTDTYLNSIWQ